MPEREKMKNELLDLQAEEQLKGKFQEAEEMLKDEDQVERLLKRLEEKLKTIPVAGEKLAAVPVMISLVRACIRKEYTDIPVGSVIAILGALIYFLSPIDLIPDSIPVIGYVDDAAVINFCWDMVKPDADEYRKWRENNKR